MAENDQTQDPEALADLALRIRALIAEGQPEAAAQHWVDAGEPLKAAQLFEKLWRFEDALSLALEAGDRPYAIRLAIEAGLSDRARTIARVVPADANDELLRVSAAFAGRGLFEDAAVAAERAGAREKAADLFRRAGMPVKTAQLLTELGQLRQGADLLDLVIGGHAGSPPLGSTERAQAQLLLGRLLARLGRPIEAARALQAAIRSPIALALRADAQQMLCGILLGLGFPEAAHSIARRVRRIRPELPPETEAIATQFGPGTERSVMGERFVVDRLIGGGGTGRVYLAEDRLLGRTVALKILSVGAVAAEEEAISRFLREAEATHRLHHPNIVALLDVDRNAGLLVLEYLQGGTLAELLNERAMSVARVRRIGLELCAALGAAHTAGIVHRDVKPTNIYFDAAGNAKLGDFGAAHLQDFGQTQTGGLIGTLAYLSPEQVTGGRIGPTADLYALGATLFESLTGRPPFLGPDFVDQHLGEAPPDPATLVPGLAGIITETLHKALAKAPSERFVSAAAMADAIALWPVRQAMEVLVVGDGTQPLREGLEIQAADDTTEKAPAVSRIGPTEKGHLVLEEDPRVDRHLVVERRPTPLTAEERRRVQRLAQAGSHLVQRILGLTDGNTAICYESIPGDVVALSSLAADGEALRALAESLGLSSARVVRSETGYVLLLQPATTD
ncbi:MAG: serine/threonine-protein kinase [Deltaproteobacteria bacterium]|nr:serine/threonine-protein kinase [Deltaproteobacteria bacterium]